MSTTSYTALPRSGHADLERVLRRIAVVAGQCLLSVGAVRYPRMALPSWPSVVAAKGPLAVKNSVCTGVPYRAMDRTTPTYSRRHVHWVRHI